MASRWKTNITWLALAVGIVLLVGAIMMAATQVNGIGVCGCVILRIYRRLRFSSRL